MSEDFNLKKSLVVLITIVVVIFTDQATKLLISLYFTPGDGVSVIPGIFNVVYWKNPGAAFGIFGKGGTLRTIFLITISILSLGVIAYLLIQSRRLFTDISLSLIAAGAVGNLIDRVRFAVVVDFLDFHIGEYHWPAFNIADSAITIGVFLTIIGFYLKEKNERDRRLHPDD